MLHMIRLNLLLVALLALNLPYIDVAQAQHIQKTRPKQRNYKYRIKTRDPELDFLLRFLNGGPIKQSNRGTSTISSNLRFFASVLGKDIRIKAIKRKNIKYVAYIDYKTLKFRLWLVNSRTLDAIDGLYRPKGLFEHRNGVFELVLDSKWTNLVLKFVPAGKKYHIIMKYR